MKEIKVQDINNITRKITDDQLKTLTFIRTLYDIHSVMLVREVCIVVLHRDAREYFIYKDGSVQDATILDLWGERKCSSKKYLTKLQIVSRILNSTEDVDRIDIYLNNEIFYRGASRFAVKCIKYPSNIANVAVSTDYKSDVFLITE